MLIECANCGAPLNIAGKESVVTCNYCSRQNRVHQTRTMAAQTPPGWQPPPNWTPPAHVPAQSVPLQYHASVRAQKSSSLVWVLVAGATVVTLGGGVATYLSAARAGGPGGGLVSGLVSGPGGGTGPGSGGVTPLGEHLQWQSYGPPPMPVDVDGDGAEDIVGFYRLLDSSGESVMYLGAFSGKDFERIWKTRPLGTLQDSLVAAVSGAFVAVTDRNNQLQILKRDSGEVKNAIQLSDKAETICANPDRGGEVWIEQADEVSQLFELSAGTHESAPRPEWCPSKIELMENSACWHQTFQRDRQALAECVSPKGFAQSDGFEAEYVLSAGPHRVGMGSKHPGTAIPMAAGYSADGKKVLWTRKLAAPDQTASDGVVELADLLGDRVVFQYELKPDGARLAAFDAATGKTEWDVAIPRSTDGSEASTFRLTPSKVYLPHWTWLDIFDAGTGKHLGTIGKW